MTHHFPGVHSLNLGKVRVAKSNALERRHLAFWGRALIGK